MKGHILEEFGSGASEARGTCRGTSWRNLVLAPAEPGAHAGHILEEFGSGASEARGTCKGT